MNRLVLIAMLLSAREILAAPRKPMPAAAPSSDETSDTTILGLDLKEHRDLQIGSCTGDEQFLMLDITTDDYGFENDWTLYKNDDNGGAPEEMYSGPPGENNYSDKQRYVGTYCLPPGTWRFVMKDLFKDGMCCDFGQGTYAGYLEGDEIFASPDGDEDWERRGHTFTVGNDNGSNNNNNPNPPFEGRSDLAARDQDWLQSHNSRRQDWHQRNGKSFVPVRWSDTLKEGAQIWANKLARDCSLSHDPNTNHGENVALNYGWGSFSEKRPTENILGRFVEGEEDAGYPGNGHLTQVLWRATKFVGCADAVKPYDGGQCHAQVCRYSKPGNCNMNQYRGNGDWWLEPMLLDTSPCGSYVSD